MYFCGISCCEPRRMRLEEMDDPDVMLVAVVREPGKTDSGKEVRVVETPQKYYLSFQESPYEEVPIRTPTPPPVSQVAVPSQTGVGTTT